MIYYVTLYPTSHSTPPFLMICSSFLHDLEPGRSKITWGIRISRSRRPEMLKTMSFKRKTVEVFMEKFVFIGF